MDPGRSGDGGAACETCAVWREHYYRDHVPDEQKQFLVVVSGDFRHSLRLLPEVGRQMRNMVPMSKPIQLKAPNGVYHVEVSPESGNTVLLKSGWPEFVEAHHIKEKFSIMFMYCGNSRFEVKIFDSAGQNSSLSYSQPPSRIFGAVPPRAHFEHHVMNEQVVPNPGHVQNSAMRNSNVSLKNSDVKPSKCFEKRNPSSAQEMCDNSVEIMDPPPPAIIDLINSDDESDDDAMVRESGSCRKAGKMASTSSPSAKSGYKAHKPHVAGSESLSNHLAGSSQRPYILAKGIDLPLQVEKRVKALVQKLASEHPIFVRVMTISTVDQVGVNPCLMDFGMEYASACLPDTRRTLLLQLEDKGKQWETTLDVGRSRSKLRKRITSGWKEFARENGLKAGDICLFELARSNARSLTPPTMTVHLIRM